MPFFAQLEPHMCLKPRVTQDCAERLLFDLRYEAEGNGCKRRKSRHGTFTS